MANKSRNDGSAIDQVAEEPGNIDQETPATETSSEVVILDAYSFNQYSPGYELKTDLAIDGILAPGFNPAPYHFAWGHRKEHDKMVSRYFTRVTNSTHSKWFKATAFDHTGIIGRGSSFCNDGIPELSLYVRTQEANKAEDAAMLQASERNQRPEASGEFKQVTSAIAGRIGSDNIGGPGLQRSVGGWK